MKINTYTLESYKKQGKPCYIVVINHVMRAGVYAFNSANEAISYCMKAKEELTQFSPLVYSIDFADGNYAKLIKEIIENDDICIGENGKTYYRKVN